ncbi:MAG: hemolysin, partial [Paludibacteraceae bacterium]|nr:hemolysin [Paludibacteraceae bacterium]
ETKKIDDLLNEFQQGKKHIAIVVDEFGGTSGIITMEDILEEIIGDINDEHDDTEVLYKKLNVNTYMLDGKLLLNDFYKIEEINEEDFAEFTEPETIAGLLLEIKGEFPIKNEVVIYKNYKFEVTSLSKRRIEKIKLIL